MKKKRIIFVPVLILLIISLLFGGLFLGCKQTTDEASQATDDSGSSKLKLGLVFHDTASPFAIFYKTGGEDAAKLVGADFTFMGTTQIDIPEQVTIFENAIQAGYDGLAVSIMDPPAFERAIDTANQKGVVISSVSMDGDWGNRSTLAYAGANMYGQGLAIGKYFFEEVMQGKGKYLLLPAIANLDLLILRMDGIKEAASEFPDIELLDTVEIGTDMVKAVDAVENAYTANPDANALVGTDHFSEAIGNFIATRDLTDKLKGSCFDVTPGIAKLINDGVIQCSSDQNPYLQGFYSVLQLYMLIEGKPGIEIDSGSTVITKDNLGPYLELYEIE